jgi:hypothetical protein
MAIDEKKIEDIFARLKKEQEEQARAVNETTKTLREISKTALVDFEKRIIGVAKETKFLSEENIALIKTASDLAEALETQEKYYSDSIKLEKEKIEVYKKSIENLEKSNKTQTQKTKASLKENKEKLAASEKLIAETEKIISSYKKKADAVVEAARATDSFTKHLDRASDGIQNAITKYASFSKATDLLKDGIQQLAIEVGKATSVGLQSSLVTVGFSAARLMLSFDEFSGILSKNRDIVSRLGSSSSEGIREFTSLLDKSSAGLSHLGKEGTKATARFIESMKNSGITVDKTSKNSEKFKAEIEKTQKQFLRFNKLYGDNYEVYADLIDSQVDAEGAQNKMLSGNQEMISQMREEIRVRTDNLKALGLSNEQIKNFNKRLEDYYNPTKNNQSQKRVEGEMYLQQLGELYNKTGDENLKKFMPILEQGVRLSQSGADAETMKKWRSDNAEAYIAAAEAEAKLKNKQQELVKAKDPNAEFLMFNYNALKNKGGEYSRQTDEFGREAALAKSKKLGRTKEEIDRADKEVVSDKGAPEQYLLRTTQFAETLRTSSIATIGLGVAAGMAAFALRGFTKGLSLPGIPGSIGKGGGGAGGPGGPGGFGGVFGTLGKTGKVAMGGAGVLAVGGQYAGDMLKENGHTKTGAALSVASTAAQWGMTGAMFGGHWGAAAGGVLGAAVGIYQNRDTIFSKSNTDSKKETKEVTSGSNEIASIVQSGPGWLIAKRPDGSVEKLTGSRNWRNNNPGNIEYGDFAKRMGAIGTDGRFAIFPNYETGRKAKEKLIFEGKNYSNLSLTSAIARYAPPSENNTAAYQSSVLNAVGGVNKRMSDYSQEERERIQDAMQKVEGFKVGRVTALGANTQMSSLQTPPVPQAPSVSTTQTASVAKSSDPATAELKAQTAILAQIAANTVNKPSVSDIKKVNPVLVQNSLS